MIVVVGENVVDLIAEPDGRLRPMLGGGPANVAVTAARLGVPVAMLARLSTDRFGAAFRDRLATAGVDPRYLRTTDQASALAVVALHEAGVARYDFWLAGAADFGWTDRELPTLSEQDVIHFGSLAAFRPPGADALEPWLDRQRRIGTVISFDPNLRPAALGADHPAALVRLHRLASLAHLIKVSQEDLALADPSRSAESLVDQWLGAGVRLVVLTEGAAGLAGFHDADVHRVPALDVPVVDTIGAGDAVSGALLAQLARLGIDGMLADLPAVLSYAAAVAALTCAQAGPDPPTAAQVAQMWPKRST